MNRLHGGKRSKWTRLKRWSATLTGVLVAAFFVVLFTSPLETHAATPAVSWLNRYFLTADGQNYKDTNPFDTDFKYEQQTSDTCKSYVIFYFNGQNNPNNPNQLLDATDPFQVNAFFFFNDTAYNNASFFTAFYVPLVHVNNSAGQDTCVSGVSGKSDSAGTKITPGNPGARKVTFYRTTDNKIVNIGSNLAFSQTVPGDLALGKYPRYFRDDERADRNNSCPDMIILHKANAFQTGDKLFGTSGEIDGTSILFSVEKNSDLSRISESYHLDSGLVNIDDGTCRVRSDALDKQKTGEYAQYGSGSNSSDEYFLSAGVDSAGGTSRGPDNNYEDDAFVVFIGDVSNMPKDPTGAIITTPADPSTAQSNPDKTDDQVCKGEGLGWIICPIISAIQKASDLLRDAMQYFLTVNPLPIGSGPIYESWNNVRNISNILFVLAFFVIIFSQATSIGISNYGIKRLLPKLILVVVATNISYFLCSFLIDIFNILGVGVTTLIAVVNGGAAGTVDVNAGAGAVFTGGISAALIWAFATGAIVEIFPLIAAAFLALLVTFLILVARQALIILLVVFSPLAFVAGLLPGTQQFLTRWSNLFVGMLAMYPIVMALFAAGRMASSILSAAGGG